MKMITYISSIVLAMSVTCISSSCSDDNTILNPAIEPEKPAAIEVGTFAKGADVSWLTKLEMEGEKFYTPGDNRQEIECMQLLRDYCGVNSIRLSVRVEPALEGWNGLEDVMVKATRANNLGLRIMLDFCFSNDWADPGNQPIPVDWQGKSLDELGQAMADHVITTLTTLKEAGITPEWCQIGNETTPGFLLPFGDLTNSPAQYVYLNNCAYDAAKSVCPNIICITHLDQGNDQWRYNRMFDAMRAYGGKYDMIGMSVYPYDWQIEAESPGTWRNNIEDCLLNIKHLQRVYNKPVIICEIGMEHDKPEYAQELINKLVTVPIAGIFYWEPESPVGYNGGYNKGCFENGAPTSALDPFKSL